MGVNEMASMLTQHSNECSENETMLQPHPDQTDTIDGKFKHYLWDDHKLDTFYNQKEKQ